ncbi:PLP-dependent aminotransferase family protein [Ureibacillus composti]|nr:PLP-dependent aminotransferase family protein [Ureibacillus composti]
MLINYRYNKFLPITKSIGGTTETAEEHVHFSFGYPSTESFPLQALAQSSATAILQDGRDSLHYSGGSGLAKVKEWIATKSEKVGISPNTQQILITAGASQGLDLAARVLLNEGEEAWVEAPSFFSAIRAFKLAGGVIRAFPIDQDGLRVDALEEALAQSSRNDEPLPKLVYTMPNYHNPGGINLSIERRVKLAQLAEQYGFYVLEDDAYGDLNYTDEQLPSIYSIIPDQTIYLGTFSKIIGPGLRVGWVIANEEVIDKMQVTQLGTSNNPFTQQLISQFIEENSLESHIEQLKLRYRHSRDVMVKALQEQFGENITFEIPKGGFFIWVTFQGEFDADLYTEIAFEHGVSIVSGTAFYEGTGGENQIRLCFSYSSEEQIKRGVEKLAKAYETLKLKGGKQ